MSKNKDDFNKDIISNSFLIRIEYKNQRNITNEILYNLEKKENYSTVNEIHNYLKNININDNNLFNPNNFFEPIIKKTNFYFDNNLNKFLIDDSLIIKKILINNSNKKKFNKFLKIFLKKRFLKKEKENKNKNFYNLKKIKIICTNNCNCFLNNCPLKSKVINKNFNNINTKILLKNNNCNFNDIFSEFNKDIEFFDCYKIFNNNIKFIKSNFLNLKKITIKNSLILNNFHIKDLLENLKFLKNINFKKCLNLNFFIFLFTKECFKNLKTINFSKIKNFFIPENFNISQFKELKIDLFNLKKINFSGNEQIDHFFLNTKQNYKNILNINISNTNTDFNFLINFINQSKSIKQSNFILIKKLNISNTKILLNENIINLLQNNFKFLVHLNIAGISKEILKNLKIKLYDNYQFELNMIKLDIYNEQLKLQQILNKKKKIQKEDEKIKFFPIFNENFYNHKKKDNIKLNNIDVSISDTQNITKEMCLKKIKNIKNELLKNPLLVQSYLKSINDIETQKSDLLIKNFNFPFLRILKISKNLYNDDLDSFIELKKKLFELPFFIEIKFQ